MLKTLLLPLLIATVSASPRSAIAALPSDYNEKLAAEKREILWNNINRDTYAAFELPTQEPGIFDLGKLLLTSFLQVSFTHTSDEMPLDRKKLIHTYGSAAQVRLQIDASSPYTGLFASGGIGIVRLSLAKQSGSYTPGVALKILVDGKPSVNFQVMYSLDGQGDNRNFFANSMSNVIDPPRSIPLKILSTAFARAIHLLPGGPENERTLPLQEASVVTSDGAQVSQPLAPFQVLFVPTAEAMASMSPGDATDLRLQLNRLSVGTALYMIWLKESADAAPVSIGQLILESPFVSSKYADESLFFQHQKRLWAR